MRKPVLYIVRGLPGSGKTTLATKLVPPSRHREADMFWGEPYKFDKDRLPEAHEWCLAQMEELMEKRRADCCVSNTFIRRVQMMPYLACAADLKYDVQVIECHSFWKSIRGVPDDVLEAMRSGWETLNPTDLKFLSS